MTITEIQQTLAVMTATILCHTEHTGWLDPDQERRAAMHEAVAILNMVRREVE
jgi:hypothetical protein